MTCWRHKLGRIAIGAMLMFAVLTFVNRAG